MSSVGNCEQYSVQTIDSRLYTLISNGYATLKELKEDYTAIDFITLYECCIVNLVNKSIAINTKRKEKK